MRTELDCLPCFLRQALFAARLAAPADDAAHSRVLASVSALLPRLDRALSPPENAVAVYRTIATASGCPDPFATTKRRENEAALAMRASIAEHIRTSRDPLLAAVQFALAGNIIDYGSQQEFDLDAVLEGCGQKLPFVNDFSGLTRDLARAETVLILCDNAGEVVFDGLLAETMGRTSWFAVKDHPVINDATIDDARFCGLDRLGTVLGNGTGCPGTPLDACGTDFLKVFHEADLVISKGQGNFETLTHPPRPVYFLLTVKCPLVGKRVAAMRGLGNPVPLGETVLMRGGAA